jgi:GPH family glycoside/pentoside/hexuronide:cation symporter
MLFVYLFTMNIMLRTGITVFGIPLVALGFEICTDYSGRVRLQGIRNAVNMLANFLGPALAWTLFFSDNEVKRATHVEANYLQMSTWFTLVSMVSVVAVILLTLRFVKDSRSMETEGNDLKGFKRDMKEIITDPHPRFVFAFMTVAILGIVLVSTLQMYLYEHFMKFAGWEKTIAHGGSMIASALGGLTASRFTKIWDKKKTVFISVVISVMSNFFIAAVFLTGLLKPGQTLQLWSVSLPAAFITFVIPHMLYWAGNGMIFPIATSMIADVSELYELKSGINKDGAYAAVFSFAQKCAMSIGFLLSGLCLELIGFQEGDDAVQTDAVIWRICAMALIVGPVISLTALSLINFYPVTKEYLYKLRTEKALNVQA